MGRISITITGTIDEIRAEMCDYLGLGVSPAVRGETVATISRRSAEVRHLEPGDKIDCAYRKRDGDLRVYENVPVVRVDRYMGERAVSHVMILDPIDEEPRNLRACAITGLYRYERDAVGA